MLKGAYCSSSTGLQRKPRVGSGEASSTRRGSELRNQSPSVCGAQQDASISFLLLDWLCLWARKWQRSKNRATHLDSRDAHLTRSASCPSQAQLRRSPPHTSSSLVMQLVDRASQTRYLLLRGLQNLSTTSTALSRHPTRSHFRHLLFAVYQHLVFPTVSRSHLQILAKA